MVGLRVDRVVTSGTFSLDGGTWAVDNNVWLLGDGSEVVVVDAAHSADPIIDSVAGRRVVAVVCTHGHDDHVTVAPELSRRLDAPVLLQPADDVLWEMTHPSVAHQVLTDGQRITVAGTELVALHTAGHSPGSTCLHLPEAGELLTGDTLFAGGPGATGRSYSDFPTITGQSATGCSPYRPRPGCALGTARTRRSATRPPTSRSGSPLAAEGAGHGEADGGWPARRGQARWTPDARRTRTDRGSAAIAQGMDDRRRLSRQSPNSKRSPGLKLTAAELAGQISVNAATRVSSVRRNGLRLNRKEPLTRTESAAGWPTR